MHQFTPIRVLLIEDNVNQWGAGFAGREINAQHPDTFPEELADTNIPAIRLTRNCFQGLDQHFSLHLLQHPEEIREYMMLMQEGQTKHGTVWMGTKTTAVPDAIVFDYLLGDHLGLTCKNAVAYNAASNPIREWLNPNIALKKKLDSHQVLRLESLVGAPYSAEEFVKKINGGVRVSISEEAKNLDLTELKKDIMGLYGGISIWQLFRNHAVVAIPATQNYAETDRLSTVSKFYEWLFEPELDALLSLTLRSQKNWDTVIPKVTSNLRNRILMLARQNSITFNLDNLLNLASGQHVEELRKPTEQQDVFKAGFCFATPYGTRCFNLAALFIDYESEVQRNAEIQEFATQLFITVGCDSESYRKVMENFKSIWHAYVHRYGQILEFSGLRLRKHYLEQILDSDEEARYLEFIRELCGNRDGDFAPHNVISVFERVLTNEEKRKVVLLLATQLYINYKKACLTGKLSGEIAGQPDNAEYCGVWSPIRSEYENAPCICEAHRTLIPSEKRENIKNIKNELDKSMGNLSAISGVKKNRDIFNLEKWIAPNERQFVLGAITTQLFGLPFAEYPKWLQ